MIPSEIATRLQTLLAEELSSVDRIRPLPADLPTLEQGARFSARILSAMPEGTYRALVAGHQITLALPQGAKSGDVLELVVSGREGPSITAHFAAPELAPNQASAPARISQAGQLISQLLTGRHSAGQAVPLNASQPLVDSPPTSASALLPALQKAVTQSGLFYESHQAQWLAGKLPTAVLQQEPQAQTPPLPSPDSRAAPPPPPLRNTSPFTAPQASAPEQSLAGRVAHETDVADASPRSLRVAESLTPLIHQQLDTLATHQAAWQGFAWPGQMVHWEISDPAPEQSEQKFSGDDGSAVWESTLRLQMPQLGDLEAHLVITAAGVAIRINADTSAAADTLQHGQAQLDDALAAAGVTLTGFMVAHDGKQA